MVQAAQEGKCAISSTTFRSIYLLAIIGLYKSGVYGLKRLQKVTYLSELDSQIKPFTFKRHHFGQYSEELADINNQLILIGYIKPMLLNGSQCCVYSLSEGSDLSNYIDILAKINPLMVERIRETIDEFGYLPEDDLVDWCYSLPGFKDKESGEIVLKTNMKDNDIEIPELNEERCESLNLAFSEAFVKDMLRLVEGLENTKIDLDKVRTVEVKI